MDASTAELPRFAFSIDEAARSTTLSKRKIQYLIVSGQLRTVKVGGRRLVPRDALEQLCRGEECAA